MGEKPGSECQMLLSDASFSCWCLAAWVVGEGIKKASHSVELHLAWKNTSQDGHQGVQVFVELYLCFFHCLLVQRHTLGLPRIGVGSFDLKDDNVEEVSGDIGHDQVDFTVASGDLQPKVLQGTYCFEGH